MAMSPEELQRRRQARQQRRQQRQAHQKRLLIHIGVGIAVAIAALVLILTFAFSRGGGDETPATGSTLSLPSQTEGTKAADPNTTVIHLAAAGDLNVTRRVVDSCEADYDYTKLFLDVLPVLAEADITTVNLEGNFFTPPYGDDRSAPPQLADALAAAGVDLVQLANSYSIYKGMDGLAQTVGTLRGAGIEPVGAWATDREAKEAGGYTLVTVQGIKIAFVSFTKGMNGMALPPGNENCVNLLYTDYSSDYQQINTDGIQEILKNVRRERPDLTVALVHWGSEYNNTVSDSQKEICALLHEEGVDAVLGTHSHYVQQMEFDPETGKFVAYSLGDFLGDADRAGSEYSVILDLEITKDHKRGETKITGFRYTPIFSVTEAEKPTRILRIENAIAAYESDYIEKVTEATYQAMKYALERIPARIKGE